jgi:hypothetical protein
MRVLPQILGHCLGRGKRRFDVPDPAIEFVNELPQLLPSDRLRRHTHGCRHGNGTSVGAVFAVVMLSLRQPPPFQGPSNLILLSGERSEHFSLCRYQETPLSNDILGCGVRSPGCHSGRSCNEMYNGSEGCVRLWPRRLPGPCWRVVDGRHRSG